jgi:hypothetical protein
VGSTLSRGGYTMAHFKKYLLHAYDPEDTNISVLFNSLDEAIKEGQLWAEQDQYGRLHIAIYQLVEVIKDPPSCHEKTYMERTRTNE